jgi:hypothetical protein
MSGLDKFVEVITEIDPIKYWRRPLGARDDARMFEACLELYRQNSDSRHFAVQLIDERSAHVLAIFAERMASLAVMQQSSDCLILGLFALSSTFSARDAEDSYRILSLYYDAAVKCDYEPQQLFDLVAAKATETSKIQLDQFMGENTKDLCAYQFRFDPMGSKGRLYLRSAN